MDYISLYIHLHLVRSLKQIVLNFISLEKHQITVLCSKNWLVQTIKQLL